MQPLVNLLHPRPAPKLARTFGGSHADAFSGPTRSIFLSIDACDCFYKLWWRVSSPDSSPSNFGYANNNFLREYECDYSGANRHLDLAGYERDICDHHCLFRLDLTHRDHKFRSLRKSE
jgi:hypothetical protein